MKQVSLKEKIKALFRKQLELISDPALRDKVVNVWVNAMKLGGWAVDDLENIPFTLLVDTQGVSLIDHTIAVTESAYSMAIAMRETYERAGFKLNLDWLVAGALLHDVGKLLELEQSGTSYRKSYRGKCLRHPMWGAVLAAQEGLPDEVCNIIAYHSREGEGNPIRIETILIRHADFACFDPFALRAKSMLVE